MLLIYVIIELMILSSAHDQFSKCGQNLDLEDQRIAGIIETDSDPLGTWPWVASVGRFSNQGWTHYCGSVVISQKFVLTAAHCMVHDGLLIRLGDKNLKSSADDLGAYLRDIAEIIFHPKYKRQSENAYYDIAILMVRPVISYSRYVRPICLPSIATDLDQYAGHQVTVTGWGFSTRNSQDGGEVLRSVPIKIFPQRSCNQAYSEGVSSHQEDQIQKHLPQLFTPNLLCAGYERPLFGPCKGDSGSPLVMYQFESHRYVLLGLVQGGIGTCGDKDFPAIFTRIDAEEIHSFITIATGNSSSDEDSDLFNDDKNDKPLLLIYAQRNQYDSVKSLLDQGADIHHVNNVGQNALMTASSTNGTSRIVSLLLSNGIDAHRPDKRGRNALHYAAEIGNLPVVQRLLTRGLSIDSGDEDSITPLCLAVQAGKYGMVEYLLIHGARVSTRTTRHNAQPIHFATYGPNGSSVIQLLLDYGADVESRDKGRATPMYNTFVYGYLSTSEQLYQLGAKVIVLNSRRASVLHEAAYYGYAGHIRWLQGLEGGTLLKRLLNGQDENGSTPLMNGAYTNQAEVVRLLLSYGANKALEDNQGNTALKIAEDLRFGEIIKLLQ